MSGHRGRPPAVAALAVVAGAALLLAGCGDDGGPKTVKVTATDFGFKGLPTRVDAGTTFTMTNASKTEVHELVAVRLPDGERRSVRELTALPQEELFGLLSGPPPLVLVAPPGGGPHVVAEGDGTLKAPGRYLILCSVPTGADPKAYLEAEPGAPPPANGGPPHFVHGMYAELTVK